MRFRIEQRYRAPLAGVEAAYVDPAFLDRLASLPKLGAPTLLDQVVDGDLVHQKIRFRFTGDVSPAVRRVVDPARLTWVEESTLDRRTHVTTWRIVPDHYGGMIRCAGTFRLTDDDGVGAGTAGTRRTAEADIKVNVPLVGGKVERAIVSGLEEHAAAEAEVLEDWLSTAS
ncbi:MAG TPA: DUF2505 family protein [Acidimicrobiales bacterium]